MSTTFDTFELPFSLKNNEQLGVYEEREGNKQIEEKIFYADNKE